MNKILLSLLVMIATGAIWAQEAIDIHSHNVLPESKQFLHSMGIEESASASIRQVAKLPMQPDGIVRLSRIEVYPEFLEEYLKMATEVGQTSLLTEPGVLTMYAVAEKEHPNIITILETYASQEAYKSHIASDHFQKYKHGTLHMVKDLQLLDQKELNPSNKIINYIIR